LLVAIEKGPLVDLANGAPFPSTLVARCKINDDRLLALTFKVEDGRPVVTRCLVEGVPSGAPLSASVLHELQLGEIVDRIVATVGAFAYMDVGSEGRDEATFAWPDVFRAGARATSSLRGRPVPDNALAKVAEIVGRNDFNPRKQIRDELHVSERTASRWIAIARERGLLPAKGQRSPGGKQ
jgi:hypothetical protein